MSYPRSAVTPFDETSPRWDSELFFFTPPRIGEGPGERFARRAAFEFLGSLPARHAALTLFALSCAALAAPGPAAASDFDGDIGFEIGAGYASAALTSAAYPSAPNGGAARARVWYGLTDALGVAATAQIAWFQSRRSIVEAEYEDETGALVSGFAYGEEFARTRLEELGLGLVYALDIMRVVPYLSAGFSSLRAVEAVGSETRVDYDAVLWLEVGADLALADHVLLGAGVVFDVFLAKHTEFSGQTAILVHLGFAFHLGKVGER